MGNFGSLIADLESAIHEGQQDKRVAILRQVTDLFVVGAAGFKEEHVNLFGDVLARLINQVESKVLADLSAKLAPVRNAPNAIVQRFARDDEIAVAGPMLSQSMRLSDDDLVEIAKSKGQTHLGAISERARLAVAVTDILVERGDATVVRKLSLNEGASFSNDGFNILSKRAETDEQLAVNLGGRVDVPSNVLRELMAKATETVRRRLLAGAAPERQAAIKKAIDAAASLVSREVSAPRDFKRAGQLVDDMRERGKLNEAAIVRFAQDGYYEEMVVAMARLCMAPIDLIDPLVQNPSYEGLLTACKACDFNWQTFSAILTHRFPDRPMAVAEREQAVSDYHKMSPETAKRIYRFWLVRGVASAN